jgi:dihydrofolate synthase/folylpolyglutamate synthase
LSSVSGINNSQLFTGIHLILDGHCNMNYQQTIDYLFSRLPMFSRQGAAAYKKDLTNTIAFCSLCDNPHTKFKSIHIAGTNGKGSVSHMLAAVLQTAGYKTGLYTSPHLNDFRERIRINGEPIRQEYVIEFTEKMMPHIPEIEPSFFELTVAMAFSYFAEERVDIAIIETGLGGRLDSTNVITPELSLITNIGWDHMNLLGNTQALIAGEKAGIIKKNIPVVIGESMEETRTVFLQKAGEQQAPIFFAEEEWNILRYGVQKGIDLEIRSSENKILALHLDLGGIYQLKNILPVLSAIQLMQKAGWAINDQHVKDGLSNVQVLTGLQGRWQVWKDDSRIVLDVGHNQDGIEQINHQLSKTDYAKLHIIIGMVKDKEIDEVLKRLPKEATYYFTNADIPRALPADQLCEQAIHQQLSGMAYATITEAIHEARSVAGENDLILICGSVFLVGEAIDALKK